MDALEIRNIIQDEFNNEREIEGTTFVIFFNMVKNFIESRRPWTQLRDSDSLSLTPGVGNETALPTDFQRVYPIQRDEGNIRTALALSFSGAFVPFSPIQLGRREELEDSEQLYWIDMKTRKIGITGSQAGTGYLSFIRKSTDLTGSSDAILDAYEWEFPSEYHPILAFLIAEMYKSNTDYDETVLIQAIQHNKSAAAIWSAMVMWDDSLQRAELGL